MDKISGKLLITPIIGIFVQLLVWINSIILQELVGSVQEPGNGIILQSLFWSYELEATEVVYPRLFTVFIWFIFPVISAVVFGKLWSDHEVDLKLSESIDSPRFSSENPYFKSLRNQAVLMIIFMELVAMSYGYVISANLPKSFIESFLAMNLYYLLPLLFIWYFITESFTPILVFPRNESRVISISFILMLYFVYTVVISIGSVK